MEYSDNGRGGWRKFDADGTLTGEDVDDTNEATITGTAAEGKYVRLVVEFEDANGTDERVVSQQPIKVGKINTIPFEDDDEAPGINYGSESGDIPVGRTLLIDFGDAEPSGGSATAEWFAGNKKVGDGTSYKVTDADRGMEITVRVTSRDKDKNVVSIMTLDGNREVVDPPANSGPTTSSKVTDDTYTINLGAAPANDDMADDNTLVSLEAEVPMASLFDDIEGGLSFAFGTPEGFAPQTIGGPRLDVSLDANGEDEGNQLGDQLIIIDEKTGKVNYYTTLSQTHDGSDDDGTGNFITSLLTANDDPNRDGTPDASDMVTVRFRIDVEPTGFQVNHVNEEPTEGAVDLPPNSSGLAADFQQATNQTLDLIEEITVKEDEHGVQENQQIVARIDVQDQNMGSHEYGKYDFVVSDKRFEVVHVDKDNTDGSQAIVRLKTGQKLDYEVENADDDDTIQMVVTATPENGNFDPISIRLTLTVLNDADDDPDDPPMFGNNKVPGLEDNEGANDDDTLDDNDGADDDLDEDGGTPAPMDAMATFVSALDGGLF